MPNGSNEPGICAVAIMPLDLVMATPLVSPIKRVIREIPGSRWFIIPYSDISPEVEVNQQNTNEGESYAISKSFYFGGWNEETFESIQNFSSGMKAIFAYKERDGIWKFIGTKENGARINFEFTSALTEKRFKLEVTCSGGDNVYLADANPEDLISCFTVNNVRPLGKICLTMPFEELDFIFDEGDEANEPGFIEAIFSIYLLIVGDQQTYTVYMINDLLTSPTGKLSRQTIIDMIVASFANQHPTLFDIDVTDSGICIYPNFAIENLTDCDLFAEAISTNGTSSPAFVQAISDAFIWSGNFAIGSSTISETESRIIASEIQGLFEVRINGEWVNVTDEIDGSTWSRSFTKDNIDAWRIVRGDTLIANGPVTRQDC